MVSAVQQYAVIDSARRAAHGWTLDQHRDDISELWARFSEVASANPDAAFGGRARDAAWLREPGPDNRPLAFPYNKWHSTQWSVNQAAALLITTAGTAEDCGVPRDRQCVRGGRAGVDPRPVAVTPPPHTPLAGHGRARGGGPGPSRPAAGGGPAGRALQLLPGGGAGPAGRTGPPGRRNPDRHRRHGLRGRPVQPFRAAVHRGDGAAGALRGLRRAGRRGERACSPSPASPCMRRRLRPSRP